MMNNNKVKKHFMGAYYKEDYVEMTRLLKKYEWLVYNIPYMRVEYAKFFSHFHNKSCEIQFEEESRPYTITSMNVRYVIVTRPYTIAHNRAEIKEWEDGLERYLEEFKDVDTTDPDFETDYTQEYLSTVGRIPYEIEEDTFEYSIIDLMKGERGPDNYYCKFDYTIKEEADKALLELSNHTYMNGTGFKDYDLVISRRNKIPLNIRMA